MKYSTTALAALAIAAALITSLAILGQIPGAAAAPTWAQLSIPSLSPIAVDSRQARFQAAAGMPNNPADSNIQLVSQIDIPGDVMDIVVRGDYAYVASGFSGLRIFSIGNPAAPSEVGAFTGLSYAYGVDVADHYAYVTDDLNGLYIVDVVDPVHPSQVGYSSTARGRHLKVTNGFAYVADPNLMFHIIDVSNPSSPAVRSSFFLNDGAENVDVVGQYAYVLEAFDPSCLLIINVANPDAPVHVGTLCPGDYLTDVSVAGHYAYVVGSQFGLWIIDVANPSSPVKVGKYLYGYGHGGSGVAVEGHVYMGQMYGGLQVLDAAVPAVPSLVGSYDGGAGDNHVALAGSYIYLANTDLADYAGQLVVLQYTGPASLPPYEPNNPMPPDSQSEVSVGATLAWTGGDPKPGNTVTYDIYMGLSAASLELRAPGLGAPSYYPGPLNPSITYFWQVVAHNNQALTTIGPIWSFTTAPAPVANFDATPLSGPTPLRVMFHIGSLANISGCTWSYGDGESGNTCDTFHSHVYANPGTYTVQLTVRGGGGVDTMTRDNYIVVSQPISDVDMGFRPVTHGYDFSNLDAIMWGHYPFSPITFTDFTVDDMRRMFGDDAVCQWASGICFPKKAALQWLFSVSWRSSWGGHCLGMSATSLRFWKGLGPAPNFYQPGANIAHDLLLSNGRRNATYFHAEQWAYPTKSFIDDAFHFTPSQVLAQIHSAMSGGATDPVVLNVCNPTGWCHSLTPYAIETQGNGVFWIRVYDSNVPDDPSLHVVLDTSTETWSYSAAGFSFSGTATSQGLGAVPVSRFYDSETIWTLNPSDAAAPPLGEVWYDGRAHLLISDSSGRRIGYVGAVPVNEIPDADRFLNIGGLGVEIEPVYSIPLTSMYQIQLNGQTLSETEVGTLTEFGPGFALSLDGLRLAPNEQDLFVFGPDGTQVAYTPQTMKPITITFNLDAATSSRRLRISGMAIGGAQTFRVTALPPSGRLVVDNSLSGGTSYTLEQDSVDASGQYRYVHHGIVIVAADTHYIYYGSPHPDGSIDLQIDHGSDGTMDESITLGNQHQSIFMPVLTRLH